MLTPVFLSAPTSPPPPLPVEVERFVGLEAIRWEDWTGTAWNLLDPRSGVFLVPGVRGFGRETATRYTTSSPAVAGTRDLGDHVGERDLFLPLYLYSDAGSREWLELDRAFWRGMRRGKYGHLVVVDPDGAERRLRCRFLDDGGHTFARDPIRAGWALYGLNLVAPQPYWEGTPVVRSWKGAEPVEFFQEDGLHISPGSRIATARMPNPGDVEQWLRYAVHGPITSASVGVDGHVVEVPFPLAAGEHLVIDTHPTVQTAVDQDGVDRTPELGAIDYAPIEADATVNLDLDLVGAGYVEASLTPLYERAW